MNHPKLYNKRRTVFKLHTLSFQKAIVIVSLLTLFGVCASLPVKQEDQADPIVGIPILIREPTALDNKLQDESSPKFTYALLLGKLDRANGNSGDAVIEKRSATDEGQDDLETAAGTYALRPLFVYRQQLAYRQRSRDAYRRRNRF